MNLSEENIGMDYSDVEKTLFISCMERELNDKELFLLIAEQKYRIDSLEGELGFLKKILYTIFLGLFTVLLFKMLSTGLFL